jgi:flavin-dependent dehydrogenase
LVEVDVVVVGAGPAGSVAALNLAPTRSVLLIEQRPAGLVRVGESLPPAAGRLLADMGLLDAFLAEGHEPAYGNRAVWGSHIASETDFLRDPNGHGWHLDRARFDAWLRRKAVERGAMLIMPGRAAAIGEDGRCWRLHVSSERGTVNIAAHMIVDAGGRTAPFARRFGARRQRLGDRLVCAWMLGAAGTGAARSTGAGAGFSTVEAVEDGWWYTAPVPGGRRVVALFTDADLPAARLARDRAALLAGAGRATAIRDVLAGGFTPQSGGVAAAHNTALDKCAGPNWIAAGDVTISFDPIASQGLLHALFTGLAAAEAADRALAGNPDGAAGYRRVIDRVKRVYLQRWAACYGMETRWEQAPFWRRRSEIAARIGQDFREAESAAADALPT